MVKRALVKDHIDDGARLILACEKHGIPIEGAFWLYRPEGDYWRLILGSPLAEEYGPRAAYRELRKVFEESELSVLEGEDVSILGPHEPDYVRQRRQALGPGQLDMPPAPPGRKTVIFEDSVIYR